jgi:aryl-alcohol dehydrogenase-like predicted oxidoreductase
MGKQGLMATMQGYGCMGLTAFYGAAMQEEDACKVLEAAYECGVRHFDTAEIYAGKDSEGNPKHNEVAVGMFVKKKRAEGCKDITVASKYFPGIVGGGGSPEKAACAPEQVRAAVDASLQRLGLDYIDLYYLHRIPGQEGMTQWMHTAKELVAEGKIKYLGISEASAETIRKAHTISPLTAVQQEWSLLVRNLEAELVPVCRELGVAIVAYSPMARGFTSATIKKAEDWQKVGTEDKNQDMPKFQTICPYLSGDNLEHNAKLLESLETQAATLGVSPAELSLAWVQLQGEDVFPIPGTTKPANVEKNTNAARLAMSGKVTPEIMAKIAIDPGAMKGDRYPGTMQERVFEGVKRPRL